MHYLKGFPNALLAVVLLATATAPSAQECTVPPRGLVYWLTGDGDYDDHAGFHNGSANGEVPFIEGRVGPALRFVDDAASIATDTSAEEMAAVADTFTYEFWARPAATAPDCPESQSGNCSGTPQPFAVFPAHGGSDGTVAGVGIVVGTNAVCVAEHAAFHLPCLLRHEATIDDWTHVAVVVENWQPRLYLDGQLVRIGLGSLRAHVHASWQLIGSGTTLGHFHGDIDEFSVYDRALGDAEIAAIFAAGGAGKCRADCGGGDTGATDDAWDVARGGMVTASSQMHSTGGVVDSFAADSLGAQTAAAVEPGITIFRDLAPDGTVHFIEWRTSAAFELHGFRLHAAHDAAPQQRAFRAFRLFAREAGAASYTTVYAGPVGVPYPEVGELLPSTRELKRCPKQRPFQAQEFRAEVTQDGDFPGGPRVVELDGFGADRIFADGFDPGG
jgi:hypothetical protein